MEILCAHFYRSLVSFLAPLGIGMFLFLFCFVVRCCDFFFLFFFCFDPFHFCGIWHLAFGILVFVFSLVEMGRRALFCITEENLFTSTIVYIKSLLSGKQRLIATAFKRECKERERERKSESESESERARKPSV